MKGKEKNNDEKKDRVGYGPSSGGTEGKQSRWKKLKKGKEKQKGRRKNK